MTTPTDTDQLVADLAALAPNGLYLDDDRYIDWSSRDGDNLRLELGDQNEAASISMSRDDLLALQQRLTAWLLANPA